MPFDSTQDKHKCLGTRVRVNPLLLSARKFGTIYLEMREEAKPWLEKADENLDLAEYLFEGARYAPACYMCQQALEVLLKAAIIELAGKRHPKIHDLDKLYVESGLPDREKHKDFLVTTSAHYHRVRYPDFVKHKYNRQVAREVLNETKELFRWIRKKVTKE